MAQVVRRLWRLWLSAFTPQGISGWVVGFTLAGATIGIYWAAQPPSRIDSIKEDDGIVVRGGRMIILYRTLKRTDCPSSVTRWVFPADASFRDGDGPIMEPISTSSAPPAPLGDIRFGVVLHMPLDAPLTDYFYQTRTQYYFPCNLLHPSPINSVPQRFSYVAGRPGMAPQVVLAAPDQPVTVLSGTKP